MIKRRSAGVHPWHLLPDELWALILSKCTWLRSWDQVNVILLWRPGAAAVLQSRDDLLLDLLHGTQLSAHDLCATDDQHEMCPIILRAAVAGRTGLVEQLLPANGGNSSDEEVDVALSVAGECGQINVVRLLLQHSRRGLAAALAAGRNGHQSTVDMVITHVLGDAQQAWLPPTVPDEEVSMWAITPANLEACLGKPPSLRINAMLGRRRCVALLLQMPWFFNVEADVLLALHLAAACGQEGVVQVMLAHTGPNIPMDIMEQMLGSCAIRAKPGIMQMLKGGAAVRTRAARRRLEQLVAGS